MPIAQTASGTRRAGGAVRPANRAAKPIAAPIENDIADRRNGGTFPDAAVRSASSAHIAMAEKPMSVARAKSPIPEPLCGFCAPAYWLTASNRRALTTNVPISVVADSLIGA